MSFYRLNKVLKRHKLNSRSVAVLESIVDCEKSLTEIAGEFLITTAAVTQLVDSLEREDLAERKPCSHDRWRILLFPTEFGKTVLHQAKTEVTA